MASKLSARERIVVEHALDNLTAKESSLLLDISTSAIYEYRRRAYEKLDVSSLDELRSSLAVKKSDNDDFEIERERFRLSGYDSYLLASTALFCLAAIIALPRFVTGISKNQTLSPFGTALVVVIPFTILGFIFAVLSTQRKHRIARMPQSVFEKCATSYLESKHLSELASRILCEIAKGKTTQEIQRELHVAQGTVNSARARGYAALNVHSKSELTRELLRHAKPGFEDLL